MAIEYVDSTQLDSYLTSVADAIRTKGGTSAQLAFPQGFVDAVEAIEAGGGDPYAIARTILNRSITEYIDPELEELGGGVFNGCPNLVTLQLHGLKRFLGPDAIGTNSPNVGPLAFPSLTGELVGYALRYCWAPAIDFGSRWNNGGTYGIRGYCMQQAHTTVLIFRYPGVVPLGNIPSLPTAFQNNNTGGTLYVHQAQIAGYQAATNWSTVLGYANNQILPIEGSIYETQYADGTPIE